MIVSERVGIGDEKDGKGGSGEGKRVCVNGRKHKQFKVTWTQASSAGGQTGNRRGRQMLQQQAGLQVVLSSARCSTISTYTMLGLLVQCSSGVVLREVRCLASRRLAGISTRRT